MCRRDKSAALIEAFEPLLIFADRRLIWNLPMHVLIDLLRYSVSRHVSHPFGGRTECRVVLSDKCESSGNRHQFAFGNRYFEQMLGKQSEHRSRFDRWQR